MSAPRRYISLTLVRHLANFARGELELTKACDLVGATSVDAEDVEIIVGTDDPADGSFLAPETLNDLAFRLELVRCWNEVRFYLDAFGLAVVAVPREMAAWYERLTTAASHALDGGSKLACRVVPFETEGGRLYEEDGEWVYEPRDADPQRRRANARFDYHVYRDEMRQGVRPVELRDLLLTSMSSQFARLVTNEQDMVRSRQTGEGARARPYALASPLIALERTHSMMFVFDENTVDADSVRTHTPMIYESRPPKDVMPDLIGQEALQRPTSHRFAAQEESHLIYKRAFADCYAYMRGMQEVPRYGDPDGTEQKQTKSQAMRKLFDCPAANDEAILLPPHMGRGTFTMPEAMPTLVEWRAHYLHQVALYVDLPVSYVDRSYTGMRDPATTRARSAQSSDTGLIDRQVERAMEAQRRRMRYFFGWLYKRTYAGIEWPLLDQWLATVQDHDNMMMARRLLLRAGAPAESKPERRDFLAEALPAAAPARGRKRKLAQLEADDEGDDGTTTTELRLLIAERMQARAYLPATIQFRSDLVQREKEERPEESLSESVLKTRIEMVKALIAAAGTQQKAVASAESVCAAIADLFSVKLEVGPKPPAPTPGSS